MENEKFVQENDLEGIKKNHYDDCNRKVAILCNHQKAVSKNHEDQMKKKLSDLDEK